MTALVVLLALAAAEADPCGGVQFNAGRVVTGWTITPSNASSPESSACIKHLGSLIAARRNLRSLTVSARVPDDERPAGTALPSAKLVARMLSDAGVPAARISAVAPRTEAIEATAMIELRYLERPPEAPVARVILFDDDVTVAGEPATRGADVRPGDVIAVPEHGAARIRLADGSELQLVGDTELRVDSLALNRKGARQARVVMARGVVAADVVQGERGAAFVFQTPVGEVDGEAATFRLTVDDEGARVEVTEGTVDLLGKRELTVKAGHASRLDANGRPVHAKALLQAPAATGPLHGKLEAPVPLRFSAVEKAAGYQVVLSRNASFSADVHVSDVEGTEVPLPADVTTGRWFWRVAAVDEAGNIGLPSRTHAFTLP